MDYDTMQQLMAIYVMEYGSSVNVTLQIQGVYEKYSSPGLGALHY